MHIHTTKFEIPEYESLNTYYYTYMYLYTYSLLTPHYSREPVLPSFLYVSQPTNLLNKQTPMALGDFPIIAFERTCREMSFSFYLASAGRKGKRE